MSNTENTTCYQSKTIESYSYEGGELVVFFLNLPSEKIVELKFLTEAHGGLCVLRTIDQRLGDVALLSTKSMKEECQRFIGSIAEQLEIKNIPPDNSLKTDWLLAEVITEGLASE